MMNPETRFSSMREFATLRDRYEMAEISLSEVMQQDYVGVVSDIDAFSGTMVNSMYFEVELDAVPQSLSLGRGRFTEVDHYLFGFVHMDIAALSGDYQVPDGFLGLGGNATFDSLLEVRNGKLRVPRTVDVLYSLDGTPYFGPAHYHSAENPGPEFAGIPYIGWMAGHQEGEMGERLLSRPERYTKVYAPAYIDDEGFNSGFDGSLPYEFASLDTDSESTGGDLERHVRKLQVTDNSILSFSNTVAMAKNARKRACLHYSKLNNSNILISGVSHYIRVETDDTTTSDGLTVPVRTEESHHGVVFSIDYEQLLILNSPFGWLYEFHLSAENPNTFLLNSFFLRSRNLRFKVNRKRVTNSPTAASKTGVSKYETHEIEKEPVCISYTADGRSGTPSLISTENDFSYVLELPDTRPTSGQIDGIIGNKYRTFIVKDFDLYKNVNFGNYKYSVEIDVLDGIKKVVKSRYTNFKRALPTLTDYSRIASIPTIYATTQEKSLVLSLQEQSAGQYDDNSEDGIARRSSYVSAKTEVVSVGHFDPMKNDYTNKFRQYTDMNRKLETLVTGFIGCYTLIYKGRLNAVQLKENLLNLIQPSSVAPGGIEKFQDMCNKLDIAINKIATDGKIDVDDPTTKASIGDTDADINTLRNLGSDLTPGIINVSSEIEGVVTALTGTEILYEPPIRSIPEPAPIPQYVGAFGVAAQMGATTLADTLSPFMAMESPSNYQGVLRHDRVQNLVVSVHTVPAMELVPSLTNPPPNYFTVTQQQAVKFPASMFVESTIATAYAAATTSMFGANQYNSLGSQLATTMNLQIDDKGALSPKASVFKPDALTGKQSLESQLGVTISYSTSRSKGATRFKKEEQKRKSNIPTKQRPPETLSFEMERVLCEAALKEPEKKAFIKSVRSSYKSTVLTIDLLGGIDDDMQKISPDINVLSDVTTGVRDWKSIANSGKDQISNSMKAAEKAKSFPQKVLFEPMQIVPGEKEPIPITTNLAAGTMALVRYEPISIAQSAGIVVNNVFLTR